jgi:hypothetical protein
MHIGKRMHAQTTPFITTILVICGSCMGELESTSG